jgi:hypothetical protein
MAVDVTPIMTELLARNRGPDPVNPDQRQSPDYGVVATLDDSILDMVLTFRSGAAYCCMEWADHLPMFLQRWWDRLRRALVAHGITPPPRLEVRLTCVIEEGALFFDLSKPGSSRQGSYAFAPARAHRYQVSASEAETCA